MKTGQCKKESVWNYTKLTVSKLKFVWLEQPKRATKEKVPGIPVFFLELLIDFSGSSPSTKGKFNSHKKKGTL